MIIFNVSALQEEGIYQVGKGYLYSLLLLVVCDWWIWGAVCSCRARLGIRKELGGFLSSADRTESGLKGLLSALCVV